MASHKCPLCRKKHLELRFAVPWGEDRHRYYCCEEHLQWHQKTEKVATKPKAKSKAKPNPAPEPPPPPIPTQPQAHLQGSDWTKCKDYLLSIYGIITPPQWANITRGRTDLRKKYPDITDKKIYLTLVYAFSQKGWAAKGEPSMAPVYVFYEEAKLYYKEKQRKIQQAEESFRCESETKRLPRYWATPRKSKPRWNIDDLFSAEELEEGEE